MNNLIPAVAVSLLYACLIFLVAWYAHQRKESGHSLINNPYIYTLSIAVYCTAWTFYGSVGKAATSGVDFLYIFLGPSLIAFSWMFLLRRIVKISHDNNITSLADFLSLRYGRSIRMGALVTIVVFIGMLPYLALQIKAVITSFYLISGAGSDIAVPYTAELINIPIGLVLVVILSVFSIIFGARQLIPTERHEGLIAAIAFESLVKLVCLMGVGIFVTYFLFNGFSDIIARFQATFPEDYTRLFSLASSSGSSTSAIPTPPLTLLFMSMGAVMLLPRQFHVMVIENTDENHITKAMWLFPLYLFLINLFVMPIALGGILTTGSRDAADFFVIRLPLITGHPWIAMLAFIGGLSAAASMVIVESVAISTMMLNHVFVPMIVRLSPHTSFQRVLLSLKRLGICVIILAGYSYCTLLNDTMMLATMGMLSFAAASQFVPSVIGGLFWRRGNAHGAIIGLFLGFIIWFYTLFIPSLVESGWISRSLIEYGLLGIPLLKPTALFGLTGLDQWSHSLFWSLIFNSGGYFFCSIVSHQSDREKDQVKKFISIHDIERRQNRPAETKRLSKPVTISQFISLLSKFLGAGEAQAAMSQYLGAQNISDSEHISEFELPNMKRFIEKTLAGSVGVAAAGAIVDSFLSDMGSRMESVYDIFSSVRTSLDQSREALFVRLKASEIINQTLDIQIIMDELLHLLHSEFKFKSSLIQLVSDDGSLQIQSSLGFVNNRVDLDACYLESKPYVDMVQFDRKVHFVNDVQFAASSVDLHKTLSLDIRAFAHIPIMRSDDLSLGVISVFSQESTGFFTQEFINLLSSLAGQLAQAIIIAREIEAREHEREQKEQAQLVNERVKRDMEIAHQIQSSLLPDAAPYMPGIDLAGKCVSASQVGGDYFDFFLRDESTLDIVIADVSGHSVGAALLMSEVRTLLRPEVTSAQSCSMLLMSLNDQLYNDLTRSEMFISMFYMKFSSETGNLSFANAGHNHPLIYRRDTDECIELDADGLILGVKQSVYFEECSVQLVQGDIVLLYTDGLLEAVNQQGECYGLHRIISHLKALNHLPAQEIINSFYNEIYIHSKSQTLYDDISMVILKIL